MSTATLEQKTTFTVEQFHWLGEHNYIPQHERIELIDGELRKMSPIGGPHAWLLTRLIELIGKCDASLLIWSQNPLKAGPNSELYPDLMLLRRGGRFQFPKLPVPSDVHALFEIADSSLAFDLGEKMRLYARAGIPEYFVLDLKSRTVHRFAGPGAKGFAIHEHPCAVIAPVDPALAPVRVDVAELFAPLSQ